LPLTDQRQIKDRNRKLWVHDEVCAHAIRWEKVSLSLQNLSRRLTFERIHNSKTLAGFWATPIKKRLDTGMFSYGHVSTAQGEMVYKLRYIPI
jgi:hypothetical protein